MQRAFLWTNQWTYTLLSSWNLYPLNIFKITTWYTLDFFHSKAIVLKWFIWFIQVLDPSRDYFNININDRYSVHLCLCTSAVQYCLSDDRHLSQKACIHRRVSTKCLVNDCVFTGGFSEASNGWCVRNTSMHQQSKVCQQNKNNHSEQNLLRNAHWI